MSIAKESLIKEKESQTSHKLCYIITITCTKIKKENFDNCTSLVAYEHISYD